MDISRMIVKVILKNLIKVKKPATCWFLSFKLYISYIMPSFPDISKKFKRGEIGEKKF